MTESSNHNQTIAITGAGGFIGSHVAQMALRQGYAVRAMVRYHSNGSPGYLAEVIEDGKRNNERWIIEDRLKVHAGDILDERSVRDLIREADLVFHLAALIGIPYSYRAPSSYARVNTVGTLNVLEACRDECPERVIITSTSEVYGTAREIPIRETHVLQAQSPYAASKIGADALAEAYSLSFDMPVITLRPFNTYGPRQSARGVVPTIAIQALSDRCEIIALGAVDTIRDLTYVEDTARGYLALARAPLGKVVGKVFNLGSGVGYTIGSVAEIIQKILKVKKPILIDEERQRPERSEVQRLIADASNLKNEVGWAPEVDLEDGLTRTVRWIAANLHRYDPRKYGI